MQVRLGWKRERETGGQKRIVHLLYFLMPLCDSDQTPLTRAPREGQGPSMTILLKRGVLVALNVKFYYHYRTAADK